MSGITYKDAGVDLQGAAAAKEAIKGLCQATQGPTVVSMPGFFAGAVNFPAGSESLLVASADSVGTKVRVALAAGRLEGLGHDIVNHCINDILTTGAQPIFFLDYIGIGRADEERILPVVSGMAEACKAAGCGLIGGETALLSDVYAGDDFDLVGFVVGAVAQGDLLRPKETVRPGDVLVGVPSNGPHTNGYSLIRRVFDIDREPHVLRETHAGLAGTLADALLRPHRSYLSLLRPVLGEIRGMAHITGGGIAENLARVLPGGVAAEVDASSWTVPPLFEWIRDRGNVERKEMHRVFNMGVGMILVVDPARSSSVLSRVDGAWKMGEVTVSGAEHDGPVVRLTS